MVDDYTEVSRSDYTGAEFNFSLHDFHVNFCFFLPSFIEREDYQCLKPRLLSVTLCGPSVVVPLLDTFFLIVRFGFYSFRLNIVKN